MSDKTVQINGVSQPAMTKSKMALWQKVLIGMVLGVICGSIWGKEVEFLKPLSVLYLNLLKMIIVPIIFFAILYGISQVEDVKTFGRVGIRALIMYLSATIFAVSLGIVFGEIFQPGHGTKLPGIQIDSVGTAKPEIGVKSILMSIIPSNPIDAMATGNTLQIVFFTFCVGFAIIATGEKGKQLKVVITSGAHVVFKMVEIIMEVAPYGTFVVMTLVVGQYGFDLLFVLGKFLFIVGLAYILQYIFFGLMLVLAKLSPLPFYKKILPIQAFAFATSSSKATLSIAITELHNRMGVSKQTAAFILPLGASTNMCGTAIYLGLAGMFFAQAYSIPLSAHHYMILMISSTIGSIGAAGLPGGSLVMMSMVLSSMGLPIDGIPVMIGIDRLVDMVRTVLNVTGDCVITVIVDRLQKTLNLKKYNQADL